MQQDPYHHHPLKGPGMTANLRRSRPHILESRKNLDHHRRLARTSRSLPVGLGVSFGPLAVDVSLDIGGDDPTSTTTTTTTTSDTTTSSSPTDTTSTSTTTTTTTTTSTTTTTTTSTSLTTTTTTTSTTSRTTTGVPNTNTRTTTTTRTNTNSKTTTFTSTSLTTIASSTLYTQTTFLTSAGVTNTTIDVGAPVTSGVLGSGENADNGFSHNTGAIVGVSIGLLAFVFVSGVLLFMLVRKWRSRNSYVSSGHSPRPPLDGEDDEHHVPPSGLSPSGIAATDHDPQGMNVALALAPVTSLSQEGSGESQSPHGNYPIVPSPSSVDIHGASVESGGTNYPQSSQGHSSSSGEGLLPRPSGFAPMVIPGPPPSAWQSSEGRESPAGTSKSKRRSRSSTLLGRLFSSSSSRSSSPDEPRPIPSIPYSVPPPEMSQFFVDAATSPIFSPSAFSSSQPDLPPPPPESSSPRERTLSTPTGLLHSKRPDLITLESSRTLLDHIDYSRPIFGRMQSSDVRLLSSSQLHLATTTSNEEEAPGGAASGTSNTKHLATTAEDEGGAAAGTSNTKT